MLCFRFGDKEQPINIMIKDSLKLINMPLRNFGKSFKLDVTKEIISSMMEKNAFIMNCLEEIKCEIGVPGPEYTANISNAYEIADRALKQLNQ